MKAMVRSKPNFLHIVRLRRAIARRHRCRAEYSSSRVIVEQLPYGRGIWRGVVGVFDLTGHPEATRCYAWIDDLDGESTCFTQLKLPPVTSAQTAVRRALCSHTLRKRIVTLAAQ